MYHLFQHDMNVTWAMNRNPITSYSELSVPLPAAREIWLAPSPSAWRAAHLAAIRGPGPIHNSLRDLLTKPDRINLLPGDADQTLSLSVFVAGIAALVWDHRKQVSITEDGAGDDDPPPTEPPGDHLVARVHATSLRTGIGRSTARGTRTSAQAEAGRRILQPFTWP